MTRVLVTGSDGQLGQCIKSVSKEFPEMEIIFENSKSLDITNKTILMQYFSNDQTIDFCINCAAFTNVDLAERFPDKAFAVNSEGPKYLAEICNDHDVVLIHISTDYVFDGNSKTPYKEIDTPNPINVYGASKLKGEQNIQNNMDAYFIVRTSWLYSNYGNNFLKTIITLGNNKDELDVVDDQIGTPTSASDLACFLLTLLASRSNKYGTYNFSSQGETSWANYAKIIFETTKKTVKVNPIKKTVHTAVKRPKYSVLDLTKTKMNFQITLPCWENSLKREINFSK